MATAAMIDRTQHDDETRGLAYELWAFVAGQDVGRVAELLQSGEYGTRGPLTVPERTLRDWVNRHNWPAKAAQDVAQIAPSIRYQAFTELLFAGLEGAKYIRRVTSGELPPDKIRGQLSIAAVDRIGFSPIGKADPLALTTPPSTSSDQSREPEPETVRSQSPSDLLALEAQYRRSRSPRT